MQIRTASIAFALLVLPLQAQNKAPENDSIRKEDMKADLFFLAGDGMQGRLINTPANALAADFIKSRFERMGLKAADPDGSFFQRYNLASATIGTTNSLSFNARDGDAIAEKGSFHPHTFSATGTAQAQVVFVGFGITAPDVGYDDYRGQNLNGKIALLLDDEPGETDPSSPFDGVVRTEASSLLRKALFAQDHGAAGVLFARDVHNHTGTQNFEEAARNYWPEQPPRIPRVTLASWMEQVRIPAMEISPVLAGQLVRGSKRTFEDLSKSSETASGIGPVDLGDVRVTITASVDRHIIPDRNVIGLIEGTDPRLKDEYVIVCAHYDHEGADGSRIFNGADDDGSGIIGLIEIAEAYALAAKAGQRPRRTVVFAAWNSEERGLLGAWGYTESPLLPLNKLAAVLNMDMIGRNEEVPPEGGSRFRGLDPQTAESNNNAVNVIGSMRSPDLKAAAERANRTIGVELKYRYDNNVSNLMRRSDHWPFIQYGIPGIWVFTGLHPDYHTTNDRPERINYIKMEKAARLVHQMSWDLAQQDARPKLLPRKH
jgi:hypothetical protein